MKKSISKFTETCLYYFGTGISFMGYAITRNIDNIVCLVISIALLTLSCISVLLPSFMKKEQEDEMLREHIKSAKASALSLLVVVAMLAVICVRVVGGFNNEINDILSFDIATTAFFTVGLSYFFTGVFFRTFERCGE